MLRRDSDLDEIIFGRRRLMKVFISSKMNGNPLIAEREAAAEAIDGLSFAEAWFWERHHTATPVCAEAICLGHASTSDALVLLLGQDLTYMTKKEFAAAQAEKVPCMVFLAAGVARDENANRFVNSVRKPSVTASFASSSELKTQVADALVNHFVMTARKDQYCQRAAIRSRNRIARLLGQVFR
jgi:hypothetical protein